MPTIHLEAQVSPEELLKAVDQLGPAELARFVNGVLALHARRNAPSVPPAEAELLQKINEGLSPEVRDRHDALVARRQAEALTPEEHGELVALTERIEAADARRIEHLTSLARLRGVSLPALMDELGIRAPAHE